jgi:N-acetylmuramoyl-L-alanine amidase
VIASGQNVQVTISGGNGFYQVLNNSSSTVIGTGLNGPTLTLYGNASAGTSTIMICTTDMTGCGTINASIGNYSSSGLTFSTNNPMIITTQTTTVNISGGYGNYYVSGNSNSSIVQTYISNNVLTLYGSLPGNATITVCSNSGSCGTLNATVGGSTGGKINLNQASANLQAGQVLSVVISGGTMPYSLIQDGVNGVAQYSLNGSSLTITGISSGSSSVSICSASGGCIVFPVTVSGTTVAGTQLIFGQNNLSMTTGQNSSVSLSGAGGYYVSNNSNQNVVTASISGSSVILYALVAGSSSITICQTGGQCGTLSISVSNTTTTTTNTQTKITFSRDTLSLNVGSDTQIAVYGGAGTGYYVAYNLNPEAVGVSISNNNITLTGKKAGIDVISICTSSSVCSSIAVTVTGSTQTTPTSSVTVKYKFTIPLKLGSSGTAVTNLQKRLKEEGYFTGTATGYYGYVTMAAVKKYQKAHGLDQLGNVGPGTRASLNK